MVRASKNEASSAVGWCSGEIDLTTAIYKDFPSRRWLELAEQLQPRTRVNREMPASGLTGSR